MGLEDLQILGGGPGGLVDVGVEVVVPPTARGEGGERRGRDRARAGGCAGWDSYLSLHCFPILPGRCPAMALHFFAPSLPTSSTTLASSASVHGPFTNVGLSTFCHRCRH